MRKNNDRNCLIRMMPADRTFQAGRGISLFEALGGAGIILRSDCGGRGLCGKCRVRVAVAPHDSAPFPGDHEFRVLGGENLKAGYRLACRAIISGDLSVEIPESSLQGPETVPKAPILLPGFIFSGEQYVNKAGRYSTAVDLGTTTIAVYLCDLYSKKIINSVSVRNPQTIFGDDVISRISFSAENPDNLRRLQKMAVSAVEWSITALCRLTRIDPKHVKRMVVVGNSAMIHIFAGENPSSIGVFPYAPVFVEDRKFKAESIGMKINPSADILTLPLVSGYLGSDIVAAAIATELDKTDSGTMLIDIGTNGEIMLLSENGLFATSCATGPAFEGATIRHGMHAVSGAIDKVNIDRIKGGVICSVIQKDQDSISMPSGICGSGVVSAVAELYRAGLLSRDGRLNSNSGSSFIRYDETGLLECELVPAEKSETGEAITLTQKDIRAVQLAKGALMTGIKMLSAAAGLTVPKRLLVAGAFGSFIDVNDAKTIGMFPDLPEEKITMVGNAAGAGAVLALFDPALCGKATKLARTVKILDLAGLSEFQKVFLSSLSFPALVS